MLQQHGSIWSLSSDAKKNTHTHKKKRPHHVGGDPRDTSLTLFDVDSRDTRLANMGHRFFGRDKKDDYYSRRRERKNTSKNTHVVPLIMALYDPYPIGAFKWSCMNDQRMLYGMRWHSSHSKINGHVLIPRVASKKHLETFHCKMPRMKYHLKQKVRPWEN